jgi:hypothetical protein
MATSGTTSFDLSVDELIEEAYERCGLELRTGYDLETARRSLNLLIAEWGNRGLNQWLITKSNFCDQNSACFLSDIIYYNHNL